MKTYQNILLLSFKSITIYALFFIIIIAITLIKAQQLQPKKTSIQINFPFSIAGSKNQITQKQIIILDTQKIIAITYNNSILDNIDHDKFIHKLNQKHIHIKIIQNYETQSNPIKQCQITYSNDLCLLSHPPKKFIMIIQCLSHKCQGNFLIYQTFQTNITSNNHKIQKVNDRIFHLPHSPKNHSRVIKIQCSSFQCNIHQYISIFSDLSTYSKQSHNQYQVLLGYPRQQGHIFLIIQTDQLQYQLTLQVFQQQDELNSNVATHNFIPIYQQYQIYLLKNEISYKTNMNLHLAIQSLQLIEDQHEKDKQNKFYLQIISQSFDIISQNITITDRIMDFNFIVPQIQHFNKTKLRISSITNNLFIIVKFLIQDSYLLQKKQETVQFTLIQGGQLQFKYILSNHGDQNQQMDYKIKQSDLFKVQQQICFPGIYPICILKIKAIKACTLCTIQFFQKSNKMYFGQYFQSLQQVNSYQTLNNQILYYYYDLKNQQIITITTLNTQVIMYAFTDPQMCPTKRKKIYKNNKDNQQDDSNDLTYLNFNPPSKDCSQYIGNYLDPIIIESNSNNQNFKRVYLAVHIYSSQQVIINLNTIGQKYIPLLKQTPITYKLTQQRSQLTFIHIQYPNQQSKFIDLNLNLIGPLNKLALSVYFDEQKINSLDINDAFDYSLDGSITISSKKLQQNKKIKKNSENLLQTITYTEIFIKVSLINYFNEITSPLLFKAQSSIHFTIILSSSENYPQLIEGQTHYDNILPNKTKMFAFEFQTYKEYFLNFYAFNILQHQILLLQYSIRNISYINQYYLNHEQSNTLRFIQQILKPVQSISLNKQVINQCLNPYCEIVFILKNPMQKQIDFSLTIFQKQSRINLKDGQWQSYSQTVLQKSPMYFYYIPIQNRTINLFYKTTHTSIKMGYKIYKFSSIQDKMLHQLSKWPFLKASQIAHQQQYKISKSTQIQDIKKCFPDCILLITVINDKNSTIQLKNVNNNDRRFINQFKILASSSFIQLPQAQALSLFIQPNQLRYVFIDLKYIIDTKYITFFSKYITGYLKPVIGIFSSKQRSLPQSEKEGFLTISQSQYSLQISKIKKIIQQRDLKGEQVYLAVLFKSENQTILTFEYQTQQNSALKTLHYQTYQSVAFKGNQITQQERTFKFTPIRDYELKIIRNGVTSNRALVKLIQCKQVQDFVKCLQDGRKKSNSNKNNQIQSISDDFYFQGQACQKCRNFIWISNKFNTNLTISLVSVSKSLVIRQKESILGAVNFEHKSYYQLPVSVSKPIFFSAKLITGSIKITIQNQDSNQNIQQYLQSKNKEIKQLDNSYFYHEFDPVQQSFSKNSINTRQHKVFSNYYLKVQGLTKDSMSKFQLYYTTEQNKKYMNEGTVIKEKLLPKKIKRIFYQNLFENQPLYLTLTTFNDNYQKDPFNDIKINIYGYKLGYEDKKTEFNIQIPHSKSTQLNNLRIGKTIALPLNQKLFQIWIKSENQINISLLITKGQQTYLPHNYEMIWKLKQDQTLKLISQKQVNNVNQYILRKCDDSALAIKYKFSNEQQSAIIDKEFAKGLNYFTIKQQNQKKSSIQLFITNQKSQNSQNDQQSIFSMKILDSPLLQNLLLKDAQIQYEIIGLDKVKIQFKKPFCSNYNSEKVTSCQGSISFFGQLLQNKQQLNKNFYCPHHQFLDLKPLRILQDQIQLKEAQQGFQKINGQWNQKQKVYMYQLKLKNINIQKTYFALKGVNNKTNQQIFYQILEIKTVQSLLGMLDTKIVIAISLFFVLLTLGFTFIVTKQARKGYQPIALSLQQFPGLNTTQSIQPQAK